MTGNCGASSPGLSRPMHGEDHLARGNLARVCAFAAFVWTVVWVVVCLGVYSVTGDQKPDFSFNGTDIAPSVVYTKAGLPLNVAYPLSFVVPADAHNGFSLLEARNGAIRMNLEWHGTGYIVDFDSSLVSLRLGKTNVVAFALAQWTDDDRLTAYCDKSVPARPGYGVSDFLLMHDAGAKCGGYAPLTSTLAWKDIQKSGIGAFFQNNTDLVQSISITLTPEQYQQYSQRIPIERSN